MSRILRVSKRAQDPLAFILGRELRKIRIEAVVNVYLLIFPISHLIHKNL